MNKKVIVGGLCTIIALSLISLKSNKPTFKSVKLISTPQVSATATNGYESYIDEFEKRVISRSESYEMTSEITSSGCGGSAYNTQKSNHLLNSTFYLGDGFSTFAPSSKEPEIIDVN
ncbi:hypothetical protein HY837_00965 [archaeon]|nr:hypothetical protein [archaeon]